MQQVNCDMPSRRTATNAALSESRLRKPPALAGQALPGKFLSGIKRAGSLNRHQGWTGAKTVAKARETFIYPDLSRLNKSGEGPIRLEARIQACRGGFINPPPPASGVCRASRSWVGSQECLASRSLLLPEATPASASFSRLYCTASLPTLDKV